MSDYKSLAGEIKATNVSKFSDDQIVSGFKGKLATLKALVESFKDDRYKNQYMRNYNGLEKNFNKKTAFAMKKAGKQSQTAQQKSGELDFVNKKALSFINKDYGRSLQSLITVSKFSELAAITATLTKLEGRLADVKPNNHPKVAEMRTNFVALRGKLTAKEGQLKEAAAAAKSAKAAEDAKMASAVKAQEDAAVHNKFKKKQQNVRVALGALDPGELSDPSKADRWKGVLVDFESILSQFGNKESADFKADTLVLAEIRTKIEGAIKASEKLSTRAYPNYQKDVAQLDALGQKYSVSKVFKSGKESTAKILTASIDADKMAVDALNAKYKSFMDGNVAAFHSSYKEANAMRSQFRSVGGGVDNFINEKNVFFSEIIPKIDGITGEINTQVAAAVKNRSPGFLSGGIVHKITELDQLLSVFGAAAGENDAKYTGAKQKFEALQARLKKEDKDLYEAVIAETQAPPNGYAGGDKKKLLQMTVEGFAKTFPGQKILAKGVNSEKWERKTEWRHNTGGDRYKVDSSRVQVWIITAKNDRVGKILYSSVSKNHMKGDEMLFYGFSKDAKGWELLLSNVK